MARRPLWGSALGFVLLLALTLWALRDRGAPEPESFFALKRRAPDTLSVAYGVDTTVMVPGGRSGWRIIRPVDFPADGVVIEGMLKRLADLPVEERRFPLLPEKMDTYGMRAPRSVIRAAYRDGLAPDTLTVGAFTMNGGYDYVRAGRGDVVALLDSRVTRSYFFKSPDEFRQSRLMPFHEGRVAGLTLVGSGGKATVVLEKRPDGSWWVEEPYPGPGGADEITEYLTSLSHMHIEEFVRDGAGPLAPYGLDPPRLAARVRTTEGTLVETAMGNAVPGRDLVYATNPGSPYVYGVSTKYPPVLEVPDGYFRERAVVPFGLSGTDSVRITAGARAFAVNLADRSPERRSFRDAAGNWLLLRAEDFREAGPAARAGAGLAPPQGTITWFAAGDTLARVEVGAMVEGSLALEVTAGTHRRPREILWVEGRQAGPLWKFLSEYAPEAAPPGSS